MPGWPGARGGRGRRARPPGWRRPGGPGWPAGRRARSPGHRRARPRGSRGPGEQGPGRSWCISARGCTARGSGFCTSPGAPPGEMVHRPGRPWCGKLQKTRSCYSVLRMDYLFILLGRGAFPLEKGARILGGIRLNAIYGVFEIGGQGGGRSAMRGG